MIAITLTGVTSPGGHHVLFDTRDGTNDANVAIALNGWHGLHGDEYRMAGRHLEGWAIDVGAHIGGVAIPLALDHPDLRIVAVEAVPENVALLKANVARNGVEDRVIVLHAAAAAPGTLTTVVPYGYRHDPSAADGYTSAHRFVGGTWGMAGDPEFTPTFDAVSLDAILERYGIDDVAIMKIDCEACEWAFLDTPATRRVRVIVGEYHGRPKGHETPMERLRDLLPAHEVTAWGDDPVNGLFEAVRR